MSVSSLIQELLRFLIPVAVGYALARWVGLATGALQKLLRYVLFPALVFHVLFGRIEQRDFVVLAGTGVAMALAGFWLVRLAQHLFKVKVSLAAARPNIAAFVLPLVALSWGFKLPGVTAAVVMFLAAALTLMFSELGENGFKAMIREPWCYVAIAALLFRLTGIPSKQVLHTIGPLVAGAWVVLLLLLGATLHPLTGFKDRSVWLGLAVRLVSGLGIGLLAVLLLPMPKLAASAVIVVSLAPAATSAASLIRQDREPPEDRSLAAVSVIASFVLAVAWRIIFYD